MGIHAEYGRLVGVQVRFAAPGGVTSKGLAPIVNPAHHDEPGCSGGGSIVTREAIRFRRHGQLVEISGFHPRTTLLDYLRLDQRHFGTKEGCAEGDCGACTVALGRVRDGRVVYEPVNACILLARPDRRRGAVTVEDLAGGGRTASGPGAMVAHHGSQCGFCTPGIVMSLFALYQEGERPVTARGGQRCARRATSAAAPATGPSSTRRMKPARTSRQTTRSRSARREATGGAGKRLQTIADVFVGDAERFFAAPASEESLATLYAAHPDAVLVGGATDVGLWVTKNCADLDKVIWLGRVAGLRRDRGWRGRARRSAPW